MAVIVGDIHSNISIVRAFLDYRPEELHIALGDLVDHRSMIPLEKEMGCLELLFSSKANFLWGNHDLAYLPERPWRSYGWYGELAFRDMFEEHRSRFQAAYAVDGWLVTHAGIGSELAKTIPKEVKEGGTGVIAGWLNQEFQRQLATPIPHEPTRRGYGSLFNIPIGRGGTCEYGGILWFDSEAEQSQPSPEVGPQIFAHTPAWEPRGKSFLLSGGEVVPGPEWINLCTIDGALMFDTEVGESINLS